LTEAGIGKGMQVLDIGCGSGDVGFLAAELAGPDGEVVGLDSIRDMAFGIWGTWPEPLVRSSNKS